MKEWKNKPDKSGWWWVYHSEDEDMYCVLVHLGLGNEVISIGNQREIDDFPKGSMWLKSEVPKPTNNDIKDFNYDLIKEPLSVPYDPRWD